MMAQSKVFLVAALFINSLSYCSAENVYCVRPTATSCSSCPDNNHCATLSEYAQETELYFTSNTTMVFLLGDHALNMSITVSNVTRLTMRGESSSGNRATVVCSGSVGLRFTSTVELKIYSLDFTSCSRKYSQPNRLDVICAALFLQSTQYAELVNCAFHDNPATALVVNNASMILTGNNFTHNKAYGFSFGILGNPSGVIFTSGSTVLSFNGINNFINNSADSGSGGAIHTSGNSVVNFTGTSIFINNSADNDGGGAIQTSENSVVNFTGTNIFINNSADNDDGGAIHTSGNSVVNFTGTNIFINNSADNDGGGAIHTSENSVVNFTGTNIFVNNSADNDGGAIQTLGNSVVNFIGTNIFINNLVDGGWGGAIFTTGKSVLSFNGINNFINNSADWGGAIFAEDNTTLIFNGTNNFTSNLASCGGAVGTSGHTFLSFNGSSNFRNNSALGKYDGNMSGGGAICTSDNTVLSFNGISNFINNSAICVGGGAIGTSVHTRISFTGTSNFVNNLVDMGGGGAILTSDSAVLFSGTNNFINNSVIIDIGHGGAIYATKNNVLNFSGTSNFVSNLAGNGGAICTHINNTLTFNGTIYFTKNGYTGGRVHTLNKYTGGGVYMGIKSSFFILPHTTVYWQNNRATFGGAIYVEDASPLSYCRSVTTLVPKQECFFQLPGQNLSNGIDVRLVFKNNSADDAGNVLYGGAIDNCKLTHGLDSYHSGVAFDRLVHNDETDSNTTSNITSDPFHICPCVNILLYCKNWYHVPHAVYPGERFQVFVVAVGQRYGTVPSTVISKINQSVNPGDLQGSQRLQQAKSTYTKLNYTVFSLSRNVKIELHADGSPCSNFGGVYILDIYVKLHQNCPPGFKISISNKT